MYEAFFGLKRRPFAATPDPQCFLASGTIQAALDEIVVCVEQGQGIAIVSAPAGTGKTLLCERLRSELGERFESVLLRHASFLTRRALLQTIHCELNHSYRQQDEQELRLELSPAIRALRPQREALVLICDEAHQLSEDLLEELRILSDLAEHGRPLVRLVLVGQLGLEETLALSSLEALSQRIRAHVCLETLTHAGSLDYIDYRLTWAGGRTDEIFTPEALELVSRAADGVPRCLNQLCDHALLLAYVAEQQPVPAEMIREALQDLRQLPLHWNESSLTEPTRRVAASFETEPEFEDETLPRIPGTSGSVASFDPSEDAALEMESIEIGADLLHATHTLFAAAVEPIVRKVEDASVSIEPPTDSTDASQYREATNVVHGEVREETMIEAPWSWEVGVVTSMIVPLVPTSFTLGRSPLSRGFIEELVLDRYAAIDAGLAPPELITTDTTASPKVHSTVSIETPTMTKSVISDNKHAVISMPTTVELPVGAEPTVNTVPGCELLAPESSDTRMDADFDEVCDRLDERLPQIKDDTGWDSASLHAENSNDGDDDSPVVMACNEAECTIGTRSMEDRLGREVCQLAEQLQRTLGMSPREDSPVEQLRSLLSPSDDAASPAMDSVELGTASTVERSSAVEVSTMSTIETNPSQFEQVSPDRGTARPYRNLFSMLRRKQQGLL